MNTIELIGEILEKNGIGEYGSELYADEPDEGDLWIVRVKKCDMDLNELAKLLKPAFSVHVDFYVLAEGKSSNMFIGTRNLTEGEW